MLPEPPNVEIDENNSTVCFYSNLDDGISLDKYDVVIYDRTGAQTFIISTTNTTYCITVQDNFFQNQICAPFLVSTSAVNSHGMSTTNVTINPTTNDGDTCSCLENNGLCQYYTLIIHLILSSLQLK